MQGLLNFSIAQATNVSLLYVIDAYRPVSGETIVTQLGFKCKSQNLIGNSCRANILQLPLGSS